MTSMLLLIERRLGSSVTQLSTRTTTTTTTTRIAKIAKFAYYGTKPSLCLLTRTITTRSNSGNASIISEPSKPSSTWERGAISVKNTDVTNPYLEAIRDTHDPSMHLKTIEDELKGTIGKALGKQSEKILLQVRLMSTEYQNYQTLLEKYDGNTNHPNVLNSAKQFNVHQKAAVKARWELIVHRQAAGFIVNNHSYVMEHYPISEPIPISSKSSSDAAAAATSNKPKAKKKTFGDQLDWWQRIGRWK